MRLRFSLLWIACATGAWTQEAPAGFDLRATWSGAAFWARDLTAGPRSGAPLAAGMRAMLYPTLKLSRHWTAAGAVQIASRPYFREQFTTRGYGLEGDLLQAHLSYSRFWNAGSLVIRAGQLSSAFGSFLLRYDDATNPLVGMPLAYGYYYAPVTTLGLAGVQAEATWKRLDVRAQFVNSSPANRRSLFDADQYGSWAGGAGYTIRQGFRIGASAYRGPYLHRGYRYYLPGEARPRDLPATGLGLEGEWGRGPWNLYGEWQRFQKIYRAIPTFHQHTGYVEVRRTLDPRWYAALRVNYLRNAFQKYELLETAVGFRPSASQCIKVGFELPLPGDAPGAPGKTVAVVWISSFRLFSIAPRP
jgi:hypothetical protein